jgi:hypothetical protein
MHAGNTADANSMIQVRRFFMRPFLSQATAAREFL